MKPSCPLTMNVGINVGFTYTSACCEERSVSTNGVHSHVFSDHGYGAPVMTRTRTVVCCQATADNTSAPLIRADPSSGQSLKTILPTLLEMSHNLMDQNPSTHVSSLRNRSRSSHGADPRLWLWSLFHEPSAGATSSTPSKNFTTECALMDAAVFFVHLLLRIAERRLIESHSAEKGTHIVMQGLTVAIPEVAFYGSSSKVDGLCAALDAACWHVAQQDGITIDIKRFQIVPCGVAAVASQSPKLVASLPPTSTSPFVFVCHVGAWSCCISVFRIVPATGTSPLSAHHLELLSSCTDFIAAGGDSIDHAILHQILSQHQQEYIDKPLTSEAKSILLERIRLAKEDAIRSKTSAEVELLGGWQTTSHHVFTLSPDLSESIATDIIFRKITKMLQQATTLAQQAMIASSIDKEPRSAAGAGQQILDTMQSVQPYAVITHGGCFEIPSLRKRLESLCRTMGASSSGKASPLTPSKTESGDAGTSSGNISGTSSPIFCHQSMLTGHPGEDVLCATGAAKLCGDDECLRSLASTFRHNVVFNASGSGRALVLAGDIVVRLHGDGWGVLARRGASIPLRVTRCVELLSRESTLTFRGNGSATTAPAALLSSQLSVAFSGPQCVESIQLVPLCSLSVPLPRLGAAEGGPDRYCVSLELTIDSTQTATMRVVHASSATVVPVVLNTSVVKDYGMELCEAAAAGD